MLLKYIIDMKPFDPVNINYRHLNINTVGYCPALSVPHGRAQYSEPSVIGYLRLTQATIKWCNSGYIPSVYRSPYNSICEVTGEWSDKLSCQGIEINTIILARPLTLSGHDVSTKNPF